MTGSIFEKPCNNFLCCLYPILFTETSKVKVANHTIHLANLVTAIGLITKHAELYSTFPTGVEF